MLKYVDIERLGTEENESIFAYPDDELIIEEKIDGGNASFFIENGLIHMCSRSRDLVSDRDEKTFSKERKYLYGLKSRLYLLWRMGYETYFNLWVITWFCRIWY